MPRRTTSPGSEPTRFDRWAADRLGIAPADLTTEKVMEGIPKLTDLPDGPSSELGGQVPSELDSPTEGELHALAALGDELLTQFPPPGSTA